MQKHSMYVGMFYSKEYYYYTRPVKCPWISVNPLIGGCFQKAHMKCVDHHELGWSQNITIKHCQAFHYWFCEIACADA